MDDDTVVQALSELKQPYLYVRSAGRREQTLLPVVLHTRELPRRDIAVQALLDSGCTGSCIDEDFVRQNGIVTRQTALPIPVYNADRSANATGSITEFVDISMPIGDHQEQIALAVAKLGSAPLFIGHEWLRFHNPTVDWSTSTVTLDRCPHLCRLMQEQEYADEEDEEAEVDLPELGEGERLFALDWEGYVREGAQLRATSTHSSAIAQEQARNKTAQAFEDRVPSAYHDFRDIFEKRTLTSFRTDALVTTLSNSSKAPAPWTAKSTRSPFRSRKSWTSSSKRTYVPDAYAHPSRPWPRPFSSSKRRTVRCSQSRTTVSSTT